MSDERWFVFGFRDDEAGKAWLAKAKAADMLKISKDAMMAASIHGQAPEAMEFLQQHIDFHAASEPSVGEERESQ